MNIFSPKKNQYEEILQDSLTRLVENGESPQKVLQEYPAWAEKLQGDIGFVQELISLRHELDPRPGSLAQSRITVLQQLDNTPPKTASKPIRYFTGIRDLLTSFATTLFDRIQSSIIPNRYLQTAKQSLLVVLILVFTILSIGSIRLATSDAVPGNGAFPVRVAFETIQLGLIIDEEMETETHLDYAQAYLVDYAVLVSNGRREAAALALRRYEFHITHASHILHALSETGDEDYNRLNNLFMRIYLQDLELFQVLTQLEMDSDKLSNIQDVYDSSKNLSYLLSFHGILRFVDDDKIMLV